MSATHLGSRIVLPALAALTILGCAPLRRPPGDPVAEAPRAPDRYFDRFYPPQTPQQVLEARYVQLVRTGSLFDGAPSSRSLGPRAAASTWESIGPNGKIGVCPGQSQVYAGRIIAFERDIFDTDILYAGGASGGLWRSTNGGVTWANIFDDLPYPSVGAITTHPLKEGHVWIGTGDKGNGNGTATAANSMGLVYKSENDGASWQMVTLTTAFVKWVSRIVFIPQGANQDVVFVATDIGIYKSENYGDDWVKVLSGAYSDLAHYSPIFGSTFDLVAARWEPASAQGTTGGELRKSADGGDVGEWSSDSLPSASAALGRITLAHSRLSGHQTLYANVATASSGWDGVWRSADFGDNWTKVTHPAGGGGIQMNYNNTIAVDLSNPDRVYTGANSREVLLSTTGGDSWISTYDNPGGRIHEDQHAMFAQGSTVYVANDGGVFKSTDFGQNYVPLGNNYLSVAQIYFLSISDTPSGVYDGSRYYIGTQDVGVSRGPNEFLEWQNLTCCDGGDITFKDGIPYSTITGLSAGSNHRYQYPPAGDICAAWTGFANGLPSGNPWDNRFLYDGAHFYTNFGDTLYRAPNGTLPWQQRRQFDGDVVDVEIAPEGFLIVGLNAADAGVTAGEQVQVSNAGQTVWSAAAATFGWGERNVTGIAFGGLGTSGRRVFLSLSGISGVRVAMSEDDGQSFDDITNDLPDLVNARTILADPTDDRFLYVGTDFGVFVSANRGATWRPRSDGLPAVAYVTDLEFDEINDKVVLSTYGRGVYIADPALALFADGFESGNTSGWS